MNELVTWPEELQDYLFKDNSSYAIISRNISSSSDVEIFALEEILAHSLIDLRLHTENAYLLVLPYRLLQERGFIVQNDDAPLRVCKVLRRATIPRGKLLKLLPEANHFLKYAEFDISDESYAETVSQIIKNEIGRGSGSNFVIKRALRGGNTWLSSQ